MMNRASSFLLLITASFGILSNGDVNDPQFGARLEFFQISTNDEHQSKINCQQATLGSRCVFYRTDYSSSHFGTGQETQTTEGPAWAANQADSVLTLGNCINPDNCVVQCNANCTCAYNMIDDPDSIPMPCERTTSPPPTPAPLPPKVTTPQLCTVTKHKEHCKTLLETSLPPGNINNFDCFNFCNGEFESTCDFNENDCVAECTTDIQDDGTVNGFVFGCSKMDLNNNGESSTGTKALLIVGFLSYISTFSLL